MKKNNPNYIQRELANDEKLMWSGRPKQGIVLHEQDYLYIFLCVSMLGLCCFVLANLLLKQSNIPFILAMAMLPFLLIICSLLFCPFVGDKAYRAGSYYGVTDKRIIIISRRFTKTVYSLPLSSLESVATIKEYKDKSGTITFASSEQIRDLHITPFPIIGSFIGGGDGIPRFKYIENVREVFQLIVPQSMVS